MDNLIANNGAFKAERPPLLTRSLKLMKPVTWFAPMWAYLCGAVASGSATFEAGDILRVVLGVVMAGPVLLGASQVMNDFFDREVDALNEPDRLIPSGQVSIWQVIATCMFLVMVGIAISLYLGRDVVMLVMLGLLTSLAYSAPPIRAKRNGWIGNTLSAISYEGLAWLAGHVTFAALTPASFLIAALYSLGTHGIMSINDYKSIQGDIRSGIRTIPVMYGAKRAAVMIVFTMNIAQIGVLLALLSWGQVFAAIGIGLIMLVQLPTQRTFLREPTENYLKFSAIGVSFFVWGMLVAALGLNALA